MVSFRKRKSKAAPREDTGAASPASTAIDPSQPNTPTEKAKDGGFTPGVPRIDGWLFKEQAEVDAVLELRKRVADIEHKVKNWKSLNFNDSHLLRFARSEKLNMKKTEKKLREAVAWHEVARPSHRYENFVCPDVLKEFATGGLFGKDKEGSPVFIDTLGTIDGPGLIKYCERKLMGAKNEFVEHEVWKCELMDRALREATERDGEREHYQVTVIVDLAHLHKSFAWVRAIPKLLSVIFSILWMQNQMYPERAKRTMVINASTFITKFFWPPIEKFLDEAAREKIFFLSSNYAPTLLEYIDADELPKFLGGNALDASGDPMCRLNIKHGGKLPKDYATGDELELFEDALDC